MKTLLSNIDLLGNEPKLMIRGEKSYKTQIGGILTIVLLIVSALAFIAFGRDIIEKKNPEVRYNKERNQNTTFDFMVNTTFSIVVYDAVLNIPIQEIERKVRPYVIVQDVDPNRTAQGNSVIEAQYDLVKCPLSKLTQDIKDILFLSFDNYYCFPNMTLPMRGTWVSGKFTLLKLNVDYCKNTTANNNSCYSKEIIKQTLPSTFNMHYVVFDYYMLGIDYKNPGKAIISSQTTRSNVNTMNRLIFWFKNIDFITDDGWILEDTRIEYFTGIDRIETQIFPTPDTGSFFSHIMTISSLKEVYFRRYIKIQGVFAYIGGFITFSRFLLQSVSTYIIYPEFLSHFMNKYNNTKNKKRVNIVNTEDDTVKNNIIISTPDIPIVYQNVDKINKLGKMNSLESNSNFNYSTCEAVFRNLFGCCNSRFRKKNTELNNANNLFVKNISIESMCKIIRKMNIMECLVLEPYQVKLSRSINVQEKHSHKKETFQELLKKLRNKNCDINSKLLKMLAE